MLRAAGPDKAEDVFFAARAVLGTEPLTHWYGHRIEELDVAWEEIWEDVKQYRWLGDNPAQAAALDERHAALLANRERPAEPHETSEVLG